MILQGFLQKLATDRDHEVYRRVLPEAEVVAKSVATRKKRNAVMAAGKASCFKAFVTEFKADDRHLFEACEPASGDTATRKAAAAVHHGGSGAADGSPMVESFAHNHQAYQNKQQQQQKQPALAEVFLVSGPARASPIGGGPLSESFGQNPQQQQHQKKQQSENTSPQMSAANAMTSSLNSPGRHGVVLQLSLQPHDTTISHDSAPVEAAPMVSTIPAPNDSGVAVSTHTATVVAPAPPPSLVSVANAIMAASAVAIEGIDEQQIAEAAPGGLSLA